MKTTVRLKRSYGLNNAGEVCGFDDYEAESLIAAGAAEKLSAKELAALKKDGAPKPSGESVEKRTTKAKPKGAKDK